MNSRMECDDYARVIGRLLQAYFEAVDSNSDPDDLRALVDIRSRFDSRLLSTVYRMKSAGHSLSSIARPMRLTKDAVAKMLKRNETR